MEKTLNDWLQSTGTHNPIAPDGFPASMIPALMTYRRLRDGYNREADGITWDMVLQAKADLDAALAAIGQSWSY